MNCPNCNSSNLSETDRCSCGYDFSGNQIPVTVSESDYEGPLYLFISTKRLILMSIFSLGMYEAYWIYKNWSFLKRRERLDILPFWRGVFCVFFCHSLLKKISNDSVLNKIASPRFSPSTLGTWWVITTLIGNGANRATDYIKDARVELIVLLTTTLTCFFFLPVQQYINQIHESLGYKTKYNIWSVGHIVCMVWGFVIWGLILYGLFL